MSISIWVNELVSPDLTKLNPGEELSVYEYDFVETLQQELISCRNIFNKNNSNNDNVFFENEIYLISKKLEMIQQLNIGTKVKVLSEKVIFTNIKSGKLDQFYNSENGIITFHHYLSSEIETNIDTFDLERKILSENDECQEFYLEDGRIRTIVGLDIEVLTLIEYKQTVNQQFKKMHEDYDAKLLYNKKYKKITGLKPPIYRDSHFGKHDFFNFPPNLIMSVG